MPFIQVTYPPKYPLTETEKEWLEDRAENLEIFGGYFCPNCPEFVLEDEGFMYCGRGGGESCIDNPHKYTFKDAAEFEARVSLKLAEGICGFCDDFASPPSCPLTIYSRPKYDYCILKHARLAVEETMP